MRYAIVIEKAEANYSAYYQIPHRWPEGGRPSDSARDDHRGLHRNVARLRGNGADGPGGRERNPRG
jgi:hypothetical protein